jgi:hypothetical protein
MTVPESKDGRKISGPAVEDFLDLSPAKIFFESHDHHKTRNLNGTVRNVARIKLGTTLCRWKKASAC